jgi:hypothetical protein
MESQETSAEVQKQSNPQPDTVSVTANPPTAAADVTGTAASVVAPTDRDTKSKIHAVPERSTDQRSVRRYSNQQKARAGHRRNIRRSNTNG